MTASGAQGAAVAESVVGLCVARRTVKNEIRNGSVHGGKVAVR